MLYVKYIVLSLHRIQSQKQIDENKFNIDYHFKKYTSIYLYRINK